MILFFSFSYCRDTTSFVRKIRWPNTTNWLTGLASSASKNVSRNNLEKVVAHLFAGRAGEPREGGKEEGRETGCQRASIPSFVLNVAHVTCEADIFRSHFRRHMIWWAHWRFYRMVKICSAYFPPCSGRDFHWMSELGRVEGERWICRLAAKEISKLQR